MYRGFPLVFFASINEQKNRKGGGGSRPRAASGCKSIPRDGSGSLKAKSLIRLKMEAKIRIRLPIKR